MNYHESLRTKCKHEPYRPVVLHGVIVQWRCRCGKLVSAQPIPSKPASIVKKS